MTVNTPTTNTISNAVSTAVQPKYDNNNNNNQSREPTGPSRSAKPPPSREQQQNGMRGRGSYYYRGFRFTEEADAKLLAAISDPRYRINGGGEVDWSSIAKEQFQGLAAPSMLQRRYLRAMHPNLRQDEWTPEEDEKLKELHKNHGGQWLTISEGMNFTRSDYQCRKRFQELTGQRNSSTAPKKSAPKRALCNNSGDSQSEDMSESDEGTSLSITGANAVTSMIVVNSNSDDGVSLDPVLKRLRCDESASELVQPSKSHLQPHIIQSEPVQGSGLPKEAVLPVQSAGLRS